MQRPKFHMAPLHEPLRNPEFSPKIAAKRPINVKRGIMAGQQSAHHSKRRQIIPSIYKNTEHIPLSEQQIKNSSVFKMLQKEMKEIISRQHSQVLKMRHMKQQKQKLLDNLKQQEYNTKIQIWQLKNEALELKQSLKTEKQQTIRLMQQLGMSEESSISDI